MKQLRRRPCCVDASDVPRSLRGAVTIEAPGTRVFESTRGRPIDAVVAANISEICTAAANALPGQIKVIVADCKGGSPACAGAADLMLCDPVASLEVVPVDVVVNPG